MKLHFKKFFWIYLLGVVIVLVPVILIRLQMPKGMTTESARAAQQWIDSMMEKRYGPSTLDEYLTVQKRLEGDLRLTADPRTNNLMQNMFWAPAFEGDIEAAQGTYGKGMAEMAEISAKGVAYGPPKGAQPFNILPDMLSIQTRTKLHRIFAERAALLGQWDRALEELRLCANTANPVKGSLLIGHLIAVATRAIAYRGYEVFLNSDAPADVKRRAIADLRQLRQSDPVVDKLLLLSEKRMALGVMAERAGSATPRQGGIAGKIEPKLNSAISIMNMAGALSLRADEFKDPALRAAAYRIRKNISVELLPRSPNWTAVPAAIKFLRLAAEREPYVKAQMLDLPEDLKGRIDPFTQLMLSMPTIAGNYDEMQARTQVSVLRGWAVEAAISAQLFRIEKGHWPQSVDEMDISPKPTIGSLPGGRPIPSTVLRMGYARPGKEDVENFRAAYWGRNLSMLPGLDKEIRQSSPDEWNLTYQLAIPGNNAKRAHPLPGLSHESGQYTPEEMMRIMRMTAESPASATLHAAPMQISEIIRTIGRMPLNLLAISQALERSERVVADVKAVATMPEGKTQPIDPDWAQQMANLSDQILFAARQRDEDLPPDKRGKNKPPSPSVSSNMDFPEKITVTAKLKMPQEVYVVWTDGPDGKDDGGAIAYDPTNGSISRGDIVVFP